MTTGHKVVSRKSRKECPKKFIRIFKKKRSKFQLILIAMHVTRKGLVLDFLLISISL